MSDTFENDSATGGSLAPHTLAPPNDDDLDDILRCLICGVTGLDGSLVRPRWVATAASDGAGNDATTPNRMPERDQNWVAVGVVSEDQDGRPAVVHCGEGEGHDTLIRHMVLDVLASFYGPDAGSLAEMFRDGLYLRQNREGLFHEGMALIDVGARRNLSALINLGTVRRSDIPFRLRRRVEHVYAVRNVEQVVGTVLGAGGNRDGVVTHRHPFRTPEN